MTKKENFDLRNDENAVGLSVMISGIGGGKTFIKCLGRAHAGDPLKEVTIEDASEAQLDAVCDMLDNL